MPRYCAVCGAQLPLSARFCVTCGQQVVSGEGSAAPAAAAPVRGGSDQPTAPIAEADRDADLAAAAPPVPPTPPRGSTPTTPVRQPPRISEQFAAWPDHAQEPPAGQQATAYVVTGASPLPAGRPAERDRNRPTWPLLVAVAVLLVAGLIWAVMALRGGGDPAPVAVPSASSTSGSASPTSSSSAATTTVNAGAQAARVAVGQILDAGRGSRTTLVQGYDAYCTKRDKAGGKAQIDEALQGRMAQLAKVNAVGDEPFAKLPGGLDARDKLRAALQAAAAADQIYVQMAAADTVCQGGMELTQANTKASSAKKTFLDAWNPLMTAAKLQGLTNDDL